MAASTVPQAGYGTVITWAGHDIGYMRDISYSGITAGVVEASNHDSAAKSKYPGILDYGEVTIPIYFIPGDTTGQKYLWTDIKARAEREVIITSPDSETCTFNAICTKFGDFTFPVEGMVEASITLTVNSDPTFATLS